MIPYLHKHIIQNPYQPGHTTVRRFLNRKWFLIPLAGLIAVLALASCSDSGSAPTPPPVSVDTAPVGDGLKVVGYAMLGAACVLVLGKLIRS